MNDEPIERSLQAEQEPIPPVAEVGLPPANPQPAILDYNTPENEPDPEDLIWLDRLMPSIGRVMGALFIVISVLPLMKAIVTARDIYHDHQNGRPISSEDLKWVKVLPIIGLLMIFVGFRWMHGKNVIPVKYMSDPWEDSSRSAEVASPPLAVIDFATPEELPKNDGEMRGILAKIFGVAFLVVGGVTIICGIYTAYTVVLELSRRDWPSDLANVVAFLLFGAAMLFSGIRWIGVKNRLPRPQRGDDE